MKYKEAKEQIWNTTGARWRKRGWIWDYLFPKKIPQVLYQRWC